jgi:hypothetical protein
MKTMPSFDFWKTSLEQNLIYTSGTLKVVLNLTIIELGKTKTKKSLNHAMFPNNHIYTILCMSYKKPLEKDLYCTVVQRLREHNSGYGSINNHTLYAYLQKLMYTFITAK